MRTLTAWFRKAYIFFTLIDLFDEKSCFVRGSTFTFTWDLPYKCLYFVTCVKFTRWYARSLWALTICTKISVENFRQMVLVCFWHRNRNGIGLYHLQNTGNVFAFSGHKACMALVIQTSGTENFGRFGKNGKKVVPRKVFLFSRKFSLGWAVPFEFTPKFPGFPYTW